MSQVLAAIEHFARVKPDAIALSGANAAFSYAGLHRAIDATAAALKATLPRTGPVAIALQNGPDWVLADLALIRLGRIALPLPTFFNAAQRAAAMENCGATAILSEVAHGGSASVALTGADVAELSVTPVAATGIPLHDGTSKITYTSGSTGSPKGLCLALHDIETVALSLQRLLGDGFGGTHLPLLPLGVLLENIAGLYSTFLAGSHYRALGSDDVGLATPFAPDWKLLVQRLAREQATSTILVPELLRGLVTALEASDLRLPHMKLVAVGGAKISEDVLRRAEKVGLPVVQGYGLTEAASVVSLNTPADNGPGSVGRVLPHTTVEIERDGEIVIRDIVGLGYVGGPRLSRRYLTGDIGHFDADDRLHVTGRKDNLIVTAFGRNVSPEWIESELTSEAAIGQAFVFGNAQPHLAALLVPSAASVDAAALLRAVETANLRLPEYARVKHWTMTMPFTPRSGLLTANGRLRRSEITARYQALMDRCLAHPGRLPRFFDRIIRDTTRERDHLFSIAQIRDGLAGRISRSTYVAYLSQAYHHVKHTVPLFEYAKARLSAQHAWVRQSFDGYIQEERGHDEWILNDIRHAGENPALVATAAPNPATQRMIEEAYRFIDSVNPLGLLGMVFVLEGTSTALATRGAKAVASALGLGPECFSYLSSHGALDLDHMADFELLMDQVNDPKDQADIIAMAQRMFLLFADMFASIPHEREQKNVA